MIRSRCRCRTSASGSARPRCLSGNGCRHFAVSVHDSARTDSSPRRDVITSPVTPTWSPRSTADFQSPGTSPGQHHLQVTGPVAQRGEAQPAVVAQQHHPAGDRDPVAGRRGPARDARRRPADVTARGGYGRSPAGTGRPPPRAARRVSPAVPGSARPRPGRRVPRRPRRRPAPARPPPRGGSTSVVSRPWRSSVRRLGTTTKPSAMADASPTLARSRTSSKHRYRGTHCGPVLDVGPVQRLQLEPAGEEQQQPRASHAARARRRSGRPPRTPPGTPRSSARPAPRPAVAPAAISVGHHELDQAVVAGPVAAHQVQRQAGGAPRGERQQRRLVAVARRAPRRARTGRRPGHRAGRAPSRSRARSRCRASAPARSMIRPISSPEMSAWRRMRTVYPARSTRLHRLAYRAHVTAVEAEVADVEDRLVTELDHAQAGPGVRGGARPRSHPSRPASRRTRGPAPARPRSPAPTPPGRRSGRRWPGTPRVTTR